jgi:hypothetical protein
MNVKKFVQDKTKKLKYDKLINQSIKKDNNYFGINK